MILQQVREQYPQYKDVPDKQLADGLYSKFYADKLTREEFDKQAGFDSSQANTGIGRTILDQGLQGAVPFADELIDYGTAAVLAPFTDYQNKGALQNFRDLSQDARQISARDLTAQQEINPITSALSQISGGVTTGLGVGLSNAGLQTTARIANLGTAGRTLAGIGLGGSTGALYGAGEGQGLEDRGINALTGGALGALTGGIAANAGNISDSAINLFRGGSGGGSALGNFANGAGSAAFNVGQRVNTFVDDKAADISRSIARAGVPEGQKSLSDAELLFLERYKDAGVTPTQAVTEMRPFASQNLTPNPSAVNNIDIFRADSLNIGKGTASGSKVAKEALSDIRTNQIPKLNRKLIETAAGGPIKTAEEYGQAASQAAKSIIDQKQEVLRTRAKPYYEASIGADKFIPEANVTEVLKSPKASQALAEWTKDVDVLETLQNDLQLDIGPLKQAPNNSTVALHAARVSLRKQAEGNISATERTAIKSAMRKIDDAIESTYPQYKTARAIYSEDAGALKTLKDSPLGQISTLADGNLSKVSSNLMERDAGYIKKFISKIDATGAENPQQIKDSLVGAYLQRSLETRGNETTYRQAILGTEKARNNLKALAGEKRYNELLKVADTLDVMVQSARSAEGSQTSGNLVAAGLNNMGDVPTSAAGLVNKIASKVNPSLFKLVSNDPNESKRFAELIFTKEGYNFLKNVSQKDLKGRIEEVSKFLTKNTEAPDTSLKVTVTPLKRGN